MKLNGVGG